MPQRAIAPGALFFCSAVNVAISENESVVILDNPICRPVRLHDRLWNCTIAFAAKLPFRGIILPF